MLNGDFKMRKLLLLILLLIPITVYGQAVQPYAVLDSSNNVVSWGYTDNSKSLSAGQKQIPVPSGITLPDLTTNTVIWDGKSFTIAQKNPIDPNLFANLGSPANGTMIFCKDCAPTVAFSNSTCISGGTGALAIRLNGAWKCVN
jgi:hypothetical protein